MRHMTNQAMSAGVPLIFCQLSSVTIYVSHFLKPLSGEMNKNYSVNGNSKFFSCSLRLQSHRDRGLEASHLGKKNIYRDQLRAVAGSSCESDC